MRAFDVIVVGGGPAGSASACFFAERGRRVLVVDADLRRGDPDAVPVLIELLKDDNSVVRQEAILILARIGPAARDALPALQQALKDPDEQVRARAITALRQIELATSGESGRP